MFIYIVNDIGVSYTVHKIQGFRAALEQSYQSCKWAFCECVTVSHSLNMMCPISLCVCVCVMMCVLGRGLLNPLFHITPQTFRRSCLSCIVDTIVTDSFCCAKRKTAFKIPLFKSNYYSSVWASAQLNSRWHSITLPLMEENLRAR